MAEQNTSGDLNIIVAGIGSGVSIYPLLINHPFPMMVGMHIGINVLPMPTLFEINPQGLATLDDWQIKLFPQFAFSFSKSKQ